MAILFNQRLAAEVEAMQPSFIFSGEASIKDKNSLYLYSMPPLTRITSTNRVKCDSYYVTGPWPLKSYKYVIKSSFLEPTTKQRKPSHVSSGFSVTVRQV